MWKIALLFSFCLLLPTARSGTADPPALLKRALHLADLYNWSDAGPLFAQAEQLFEAQGDKRDALYARLGHTRATMEELSLPQTSQQLATKLETNSLLKSDPRLRVFALSVKGDIDGELDAAPMRRDWEDVYELAKVLNDPKLENRASGEIGFAAFLEGEMGEARHRVAGALLKAQATGDVGAQIRYLAAIGTAQVLAGNTDDALGYFDKALKVATANPDSGYQFLIQEGRVQAFIAAKRFDAASRLAQQVIAEAKSRGKRVKETQALITASRIAVAQHSDDRAIGELKRAIALAEAGGFRRLLADAEFDLAEINHRHGDLRDANTLAERGLAATQSDGELYLMPERLETLAQLKASQGRFTEADDDYKRAADIIDSVLGNVSSASAKSNIIRAMSNIYTEHFSLVADRLRNTNEGYDLLERARGRATAELLMSGKHANTAGQIQIENEISRLQLRLARAKTTGEIRRLRDRIFLVEQKRWLNSSGMDESGSRPWEPVSLAKVQSSLSSSTAILEYVIADPTSYCLVITHNRARIVALAGRDAIQSRVKNYLELVKSRKDVHGKAESLERILLQPIDEARTASNLIIVRDGILYLLPFEALIQPDGKYLLESHTISYAPSASTLYMLERTAVGRRSSQTLLAVGGVPYGEDAALTRLASLDGLVNGPLSDLPGSKDEVDAAIKSMPGLSATVLTDKDATEKAFKSAGLENREIIHLAVHGFANVHHPDSAALLFLSDAKAQEDGILQASEIAHLRLSASLVVLSACDTAVGRLQGEEGIATLSRAFMLAGARSVVSTLWPVDDTFSLFVMKRFYAGLSAGETVSAALRNAKLDVLHTFGERAVPYVWAGYIFEGSFIERISVPVQTQKYAASAIR
jgi:CHAT domain-containing protein